MTNDQGVIGLNGFGNPTTRLPSTNYAQPIIR